MNKSLLHNQFPAVFVGVFFKDPMLIKISASEVIGGNTVCFKKQFINMSGSSVPLNIFSPA